MSGPDIAAFIAARLDEDEAAAKAATPGPWDHMCLGSEGCQVLRSSGSLRERGRGRVARFGQKDWKADHADASFAARHDPARVLRDVAAKRAIIRRYEEQLAKESENAMEEDRTWVLWPVVANLAAIWSDHPDYRQEWKP